METYKFAEKVADIIGGEDSSLLTGAVARVIDLSNREGYIFHGIKNQGSFGGVNAEGIKPLNPEHLREGGFASDWNSGRSVFGDLEGGRLMTRYNAFFHAHSHSPSDEGSLFMNLVIAKYSDLEMSGIVGRDGLKEDGSVAIYQTVPRNLIHLLTVKSPGTGDRSSAQVAERLLLQQMHGVLNQGYQPGELAVSSGSERKI